MAVMPSRRANEHFSPASVQLLTDFAVAALGCEGLDAIRRRAALSGTPEGWIGYDQFRALAEAIADAVGGPGSLRHVATEEREFSTLEGADRLSNLTTPEALLERLGSVMDDYSTVVEATAEKVRVGEWIVHTRFTHGYAPFRAYCGFTRGFLGNVPRLYGLSAADVEEEACQVDGAPWCSYRLRWDAASTTARQLPALQSRILEARLEALQEAIGDLVSGASIEVILDRVLHSVTRTVLARGFVLTVHEPDGAGRSIRREGLSEAEANLCAKAIVAGHVDPRWSVAEVRSGNVVLGHLVAVHGSSEIGRQEQVVLDAYARVAASALDSAALIRRANRQAELASALLSISRSLADIGTSTEMAHRLTATVPTLVDCDQVTVSLIDDDGTCRVVSARGYGPTIDETITGTTVEVDDAFMQAGTFRIIQRGMPLTANERRMLGRAAAVATVPISVMDEVIGWIGVIVQDRPERLLQAPGLDDRLHGLAALSATAMHNARLVEQIRFQADHDPLTGLANQRLLEAHTENAIARARRERHGLTVLFLDLDHFKVVNDELGHAEGDRLLQALASRVRGVLREADTVARVGGDEFVVLLPTATDRGAAVSEKIRVALEEPIVLGDRVVHVSASIGVACYPDDGLDVDALLHRADMRMYEDKLADRQSSHRRA